MGNCTPLAVLAGVWTKADSVTVFDAFQAGAAKSSTL